MEHVYQVYRSYGKFRFPIGTPFYCSNVDKVLDIAKEQQIKLNKEWINNKGNKGSCPRVEVWGLVFLGDILKAPKKGRKGRVGV